MSTDIQAAPHLGLNVKYSKQVQADRGDRGTIEILENKDHYIRTGIQKSGPRKKGSLCSGIKRSPFRATAAILGGFYFLILAGVFTRYALVNLQRDQLNSMYEQLRNRYSNLSSSYSQLQQKEKQLEEMFLWQSCPDGWMRFGQDCYYKPTEKKGLKEGREECELRGGRLMFLNSTEKQRIFRREADQELHTDATFEWNESD